MKLFSIEQIKEIQGKQNYRYLGLFDQSGRAIIPFNTNKGNPNERLREIETRLLSEALNDGYYFVKGKNVISKNGATDDFCIRKGETLSETAAAPVIIEKQSFQPEVLTYEGALKLQVDLERLKLENANLKSRILDLEEQLAENDNLAEEAEQTPAASWIEQLTQLAVPMLDKHFALKEQQLALKAMELQRLPTKQQTTNQTRPVLDKQKIEDCILTFQDDPDTYEQLANIYNSALNQEDFLKTLRGIPDLFNQFKTAYNG
jgi:hypothetical protein